MLLYATLLQTCWFCLRKESTCQTDKKGTNSKKELLHLKYQTNVHKRKYYKAIISTDESHAPLSKIKLRQRLFENQGGGGGGGGHSFLFWVKQFSSKQFFFFIRKAKKYFCFIINHDLNGQ